MVDFISEVQEELRKDDYNTWLRRYGPYVAGLAVAVMAYAGWREWNISQTEAQARAVSVEYVAAAELEEASASEAAIAAFTDLAADAPEGYTGLGLMRAAALETERGNADAAVALYDRAAGTFSNARHADLARLKAAYALSAEGRHSDARIRLRDITVEGAPYEFLARELDAYAALADGDEDAAIGQFRYLATIPGVTETVAERSRQTLSMLARVDAPPVDAGAGDVALEDATSEDMAPEDMAPENMVPEDLPSQDTLEGDTE